MCVAKARLKGEHMVMFGSKSLLDVEQKGKSSNNSTATWRTSAVSIQAVSKTSGAPPSAARAAAPKSLHPPSYVLCHSQSTGI